MGEVNILKQYPKVVRNIVKRKRGQAMNRDNAKLFEKSYFDGSREEGYGGYHYDGRWVPIAGDFIRHFNLKPGDRVLDIGCAKGFLVKDFMDVCPGLQAFGLDISEYATRNGHPDINGHLVRGHILDLPFPNGTFDAVICINVVHNLTRNECVSAVREISRVTKPGKSYIQVDAYRNEQEKELFLDWVLTAETHGTPGFWEEILDEAEYKGDYFWTVLELDPAYLITEDQE